MDANDDAPRVFCRKTANGAWSVTVASRDGYVSVESDSRRAAIEYAIVASVLLAPVNEAA